jgi:hypothetical protein
VELIGLLVAVVVELLGQQLALGDLAVAATALLGRLNWLELMDWPILVVVVAVGQEQAMAGQVQ